MGGGGVGMGAYSRLGANSRLDAYSNKYGKNEVQSYIIL